MHRTTLVPRMIFGAAAALIGLAGMALAQLPQQPLPPGLQPGLQPMLPQPGVPNPGLQPGVPPGMPPGGGGDPAQTGNAMLVPVNTTKKVMMSNKEILASVQNENPRVARVQTDLADPKAVLITGLAPGSTRVILTDRGGRAENFDVIVPSPEDQEREKLRLQLIELIKTTVPASQIEVVTAPNNTVFVSGTIGKAEDVQIVMAAARSVFGPSAQIVNGMRLAGVHQVQLDVVIARVNRSEARNMSFNFIDIGRRYFLGSILGNEAVSPLTGGLMNVARTAVGGTANASSAAASTANVAFGVIGDKHAFFGFLDALRSEGVVKLMAEPSLVTLSGRPAEFLAGGEQAVPTLASASGGAGSGAVAGVEFRPFGATIRFLPIVLGNGKIYLEVEPQFTFVDSQDATLGTPIPGTTGTVFGRRTQRVRTTVIMEDSQTFAIGGLIQHITNGSTTKVPLLGDMPFFGALFRTVAYQEAEEEMVILVTPRLVDPLACDQFAKHLPGLETRSPDDFELFFEGLLEAPRGPRKVFPDPHETGFFYKPAHMTGPTSKATPCVDYGQHHHHGAPGHGGPGGCSTCGVPVQGGPTMPVQPTISTAPMPAPVGGEQRYEALPNPQPVPATGPQPGPQTGYLLPGDTVPVTTQELGRPSFGPALSSEPR